MQNLHEINIAIYNIIPKLAANAAAMSAFIEHMSTPVMPEKIYRVAEFGLANSAIIIENDAGELFAEIVDFGVMAGFYGLGVDNRGAKIAQILRGETVEDSPLPKDEFQLSV